MFIVRSDSNSTVMRSTYVRQQMWAARGACVAMIGGP